MTWVWDNSSAGGTERLVLLAIADCADDTGANAWPSIATLARKTRLDERTVQRVIRRLADAGQLRVEACAGGRGSNRYALVMGAPSGPGRVVHSPRQDATPGTVPPQPRRRATAGVAQLRHPNVLEPSKNRPTRGPARAPGRPAARGAALPPPSTVVDGRCQRHPGQLAAHCGPCRSEAIGGAA